MIYIENNNKNPYFNLAFEEIFGVNFIASEIIDLII